MEYENCNVCGELLYMWSAGNKDADDLKEARKNHKCCGFWAIGKRGRMLSKEFIAKISTNIKLKEDLF